MNKKNKKIFALFFTLTFFGFFAFFFVHTLSAASFEYIPMEEIPGFGKPKDFPSYLMAIYKFGLWTVGIAAMLMITIGGYMYLTSAGNNASMQTAKKIIFDAITGLILALVSYLILYIINPDLVQFKKATSSSTQTPDLSSTEKIIRLDAPQKGQTSFWKGAMKCNIASWFSDDVVCSGYSEEECKKDCQKNLDDCTLGGKISTPCTQIRQ